MILNLSRQDYLRQRLDPQPGDEQYLPLKDLRIALDDLVPIKSGHILDFGCGGSPYRPLFEGSYVRADIAANPDRDITLIGESELPVEIDQFDLVLSTQVLEHVESPDEYLKECWRALRPGGHLVLTTHGLYEDHPCPHDYWRWTFEGLTKLLKSHRFEFSKALTITNGPRAALFFLERDLCQFPAGRNLASMHTLLFAMVRRLGARALHLFADRVFSNEKVRDPNGPAPASRYLILGVCARKPSLAENQN